MAEKKDDKVKLTADTNRQEMPAREVRDDKAQEDNLRRLQDAKEVDYERATLASEREAGDDREQGDAELDGGTRVTGPRGVIDSLGGGGRRGGKK